MAGWQSLSGQALVLAVDNIDTDQLIPARFMSVPRSEGYGDYLLYDLRRDPDGALDAAFPLNQVHSAKILITGRNFGSGSSREAAVYALVDAGFRVVIAPSFGDIFANNAINNGLLPAQLDAQYLEALRGALVGAQNVVTVSLKNGLITCGALKFFFELDETQSQKLQNGWDDIDLTLQQRNKIDGYRSEYLLARPWADISAAHND